MNGIDISHWQDGINVANLNGIDFCICKATEGTRFVDVKCDSYIQECINNNILWGFYHFAREGEPEEEAQHFYDSCVNYFGNGIPILDYETKNDNNVEWCERFINKIHELSGIWCLIYISASRCAEYENSWIPQKCGLWVAGYPKTITNWTNEEMPYNIYPFDIAAIWQFTDTLKIAGYEGNLDGDIAYMSKDAWMKYANSTSSEQNVENSKSIDDLVLETLLGEYGNGDDRKRMLGDNYNEVQNRINELYKIAQEVIEGKWGNGWNRKEALNGAGYSYEIVQKIVNDILG